MKLPDTIFARLFVLVLAAIVISHLMTFILLTEFFGHAFPPPPPPGHGIRPAPGHPPPGPPPGLWIGFTMQIITLSIAAWFGARLLARPVQRLAQAAAQLGNNLNHPAIEETGSAEARQAARVFNQMQQRIRSQLEERGRFLAAVSHDLRTPLTRMKLRTERLQEQAAREKFRADIGEMAAMLDATLNYLRGEAASEAWQLLDVQALLDAMAEDARESGRAVSVSGSALPLMTPPTALRRCLSNLLENALRYGHQADIALSDTPLALLIEIRDAGPGIPEQKMELVFEPFVRLESSRNKAYGGVGLGLSIAREAARQCGGTVSLRNADAGGLIATVAIPR